MFEDADRLKYFKNCPRQFFSFSCSPNYCGFVLPMLDWESEDGSLSYFMYNLKKILATVLRLVLSFKFAPLRDLTEGRPQKNATRFSL